MFHRARPLWKKLNLKSYTVREDRFSEQISNTDQSQPNRWSDVHGLIRNTQLSVVMPVRQSLPIIKSLNIFSLITFPSNLSCLRRQVVHSGDFGAHAPGIPAKVVNFQTGASSWYNENVSAKSKFLVDFEFLGHAENGLQLTFAALCNFSC